MNRPDSEQLKIYLIYLLVTYIFVLDMTIAMGKVTKETSFGLEAGIHLFDVILGMAFGWAYGNLAKGDKG